MTTKERVHRLCVRLSYKVPAYPSHAEIATAFEPIVERLVEALAAWEHWYNVDSTEFNRDTARELGRKILAELERE